MINIKEIRSKGVSERVTNFMDKYGGNHVSLYGGWKAEADMGSNASLLGEQMCYALRERDKNIVKRILGRIRKMNAAAEDEMVKGILSGEGGDPPPLSCLG